VVTHTYPILNDGALKKQLQHLGEVKVLGWKEQKSSTSN